MGKRKTITVAGRYENVQKVGRFVCQGAAQAGFDKDMLFKLELALDEACTNVIEHAYGGEDVGELRVSWHIQGDNFVVEIQDHGRAFNPDAVPEPLFLTAKNEPGMTEPDDLQVGGLGLYFIRELMDDVQFDFNNRTGNTLRMTKRLPGKEVR